MRVEHLPEFVFRPQIVVLWNCEKPLPPRNKWPSTSVPLTVVEGQTKVTAADFWQHFCSHYPTVLCSEM